MRVLVTGGAGYIGSVLVRLLLERGYDVVILDRLFFGRDSIRDIEDRVKIVKDDIRWFDPWILEGVDAVFDLAALSNDPSGELDPEKTLEINYRGRVRVANLSKKHGVSKYVLASSCSVYGFQPGILNENSSVNPLTTYAKANYMAEREVIPLGDRKFTVTVLRQATVYGYSYRMRFDLAVNGMVRSLYKYGVIKVMRDGTQWRPFVHVKDTSNAFIKVLESDEELVNREVFNVGSNDQNIQIFELARKIAEACGQEFRYEWYGSPDKRSYRVDFSKIRDRLGYRTRFKIEDGAREVWNALVNGLLDPDDPRTITVKWYKKLLDMHKLIKEVELNGKIL
ncbi:NAD-dependent epimerase/dehydratase [Staphylothermus hellenicus DSM 12710]|uniref:NAD-dependent epimerase/dehydratase n=1 Tax=Staphylothermus hellenicus (strain DSM 12710 / JCM 10830 / BK20S6-10-b1 / P8) TaxID=591019 RepID=D7D8B4_STAHD|nr:NAD-dependent epimerase/dehydratase [Staphylothermus hellenicus DSM 12710]